MAKIQIKSEKLTPFGGIFSIMEHSGHGVPIVVREYGEKAYTFSENMITVTIPFDKPETKSGEITGEKTGEIKLKENEESIYEAIKEMVVQDCPIRNVLARVCDKWSLLVIYTLKNHQRYHSFKDHLP